MGQPLKCLWQNDLQKCPVENRHDPAAYLAKLEAEVLQLNAWCEIS